MTIFELTDPYFFPSGRDDQFFNPIQYFFIGDFFIAERIGKLLALFDSAYPFFCIAHINQANRFCTFIPGFWILGATMNQILEPAITE